MYDEAVFALRSQTSAEEVRTLSRAFMGTPARCLWVSSCIPWFRYRHWLCEVRTRLGLSSCAGGWSENCARWSAFRGGICMCALRPLEK